jgi:drug/metabolite transporter (DMT)-like permease
VDVATAVTVRSLATCLVVALVVWHHSVAWNLNGRQRVVMLGVSCLIGIQSLCLYSAVARLPVALALLAFNTYPLWTAMWDALLYRRVPERKVLIAMPVLLVGLAMALDVVGAASGLSASEQWGRIGAGVAFALTAGSSFGLAMVLTQHEAAGVDGRVRTVISINSIMFTLLPKLGVVGSSPIMNVEPVAALVMAWALLDQRIAVMQVAGALLVVGTVMALGLRKK